MSFYNNKAAKKNMKMSHLMLAALGVPSCVAINIGIRADGPEGQYRSTKKHDPADPTAGQGLRQSPVPTTDADPPSPPRQDRTIDLSPLEKPKSDIDVDAMAREVLKDIEVANRKKAEQIGEELRQKMEQELFKWTELLESIPKKSKEEKERYLSKIQAQWDAHYDMFENKLQEIFNKVSSGEVTDTTGIRSEVGNLCARSKKNRSVWQKQMEEFHEIIEAIENLKGQIDMELVKWVDLLKKTTSDMNGLVEAHNLHVNNLNLENNNLHVYDYTAQELKEQKANVNKMIKRSRDARRRFGDQS